MGVYIKGVTNEQLWKVIINSTEFLPDYCEIIEVNTPHGRLIDEDDINATWHMGDSGEVLDYVAPTVIEAEVE